MADFTLCMNIFPWGLPPVTGRTGGRVVVREALGVLRPANPSLYLGSLRAFLQKIFYYCYFLSFFFFLRVKPYIAETTPIYL